MKICFCPRQKKTNAARHPKIKRNRAKREGFGGRAPGGHKGPGTQTEIAKPRLRYFCLRCLADYFCGFYWVGREW